MGGKEINARAYLSRFNFTGGDQEKLCSVLSGGERNRLHLALTLRAEANVLLLDEPTNDIDVNTFACIGRGSGELCRLRRGYLCTTVGSWIVSVRIFFRSRVTPTWYSTRVRTPNTKNTNGSSWAM